MQDFREYIKTFESKLRSGAKSETHSLNLEMPDWEYLDSLKSVFDFSNLPEELNSRDPESSLSRFLIEIRKPLLAAQAYKNLKVELLKANPDYQVATFQSPLIVSPHSQNASQRVAILVPRKAGQNCDRILVISMPSPEEVERMAKDDMDNRGSSEPLQDFENLSDDGEFGQLVSCDPPASGGKHRMYLRNYKKVHTDTQVELTDEFERDQCIKCHFSGPYKITPKDPPRPEDQMAFDKIKDVTTRLSDWGGQDYLGGQRKVFSREQFGPPLGQRKKVQDREGLFNLCYKKDATEKEKESLNQAMNCSNCHNGSNRGKLNFPLDIRSRSDAIGLDMINSHIMSINPALRMPNKGNFALHSDDDSPDVVKEKASDRESLYNCLLLEYFGKEVTVLRFKKSKASLQKEYEILGEKLSHRRAEKAGVGMDAEADPTKVNLKEQFNKLQAEFQVYLKEDDEDSQVKAFKVLEAVAKIEAEGNDEVAFELLNFYSKNFRGRYLNDRGYVIGYEIEPDIRKTTSILEKLLNKKLTTGEEYLELLLKNIEVYELSIKNIEGYLSASGSSLDDPDSLKLKEKIKKMKTELKFVKKKRKKYSRNRIWQALLEKTQQHLAKIQQGKKLVPKGIKVKAQKAKDFIEPKIQNYIRTAYQQYYQTFAGSTYTKIKTEFLDKYGHLHPQILSIKQEVLQELLGTTFVP